MSQIKQIAGYDVLDVLGYGASSTIYAVRNARDDQVFAIKRVLRRTPSDQRFIDQALTEHEVASKLDHPLLRKSYRIIRKRRLLRTTELLVLMEMVDGTPLEHRRPDSVHALVEVFGAVAEGLDAMHRQSYVHCDMKPNNILVLADGGVKIIDFGQACPIGTAKQRIQGTPDYIAPEQVMRLPLTQRTDIFNLGATMYWCLTSQHVPTMIPRTEHEVAIKPNTSFRRPAEVNDTVPKALDVLVMSCLEQEPANRPGSMKEIQSRLEMVLRQLEREPRDKSA
jgi:serine/threonine-protein kinase